MTERRKLQLESEMEALAEIARLRAGYNQLGDWTLPQICWHCSSGMRGTLTPPASTEPTPEQRKGQEFINLVATQGWPDQKFPAVQPMIPPADAGDEAIEEFIGLLRELAFYKHSHADHKHFFGPVPIEPYRKFILRHLAHHLSYLQPTKPARRKVSYGSEDDVIADIQKLRKGYGQAGMWSLPQVCWHLDVTTQARMKPGPFPPNTPEQDAARPIFETVLRTGQLPPGIKAPDALVPPASVGDEAIDAFIATMQKWKAFTGPVAPHRIFGHMTREQARRQILVHCANHLSCLLPLGQ